MKLQRQQRNVKMALWPSKNPLTPDPRGVGIHSEVVVEVVVRQTLGGIKRHRRCLSSCQRGCLAPWCDALVVGAGAGTSWTGTVVEAVEAVLLQVDETKPEAAARMDKLAGGVASTLR